MKHYRVPAWPRIACDDRLSVMTSDYTLDRPLVDCGRCKLTKIFKAAGLSTIS